MKEITYLPNEYLEEMDCLGDAEFGRLIRGLLYYSINGEEPELKGTERLFWKTVRNRENRFADAYTQKCSVNAKNGMKGGRPKNPTVFSENPKNPTVFLETQKSQLEQNPNRTTTELNRDIKAPTEPNAPAREKTADEPKRHKYGEYGNVLLSDSDLEKLKAEFPTDWQARIENLSSYMASKGVSYKNHLATIRNWARKDGAKAQKPFGSASNDATSSKDDKGSVKNLQAFLAELKGDA